MQRKLSGIIIVDFDATGQLLIIYSAFVKYLRKNGNTISGVPRNFVRGGSTNSVENRGQRERGSGGGSPLVRGSGGSWNLVQEISFHIVKFS